MDANEFESVDNLLKEVAGGLPYELAKDELKDIAGITYFKVICSCETELEIEDGCTAICGNCGQELDDRGNVL